VNEHNDKKHNQLLTGMHYKVMKTDSQKSSKKDNYENKW